LCRLAHAIGLIAQAQAGTEAGRLADAMRAHPEYVSGTQRAERAVFGAVPGVIVKSGAESVYVAGLPDGSGIALKIEDGSERPLYAVMNRALQLAGYDAPLLAERPEVLGGGKRVGEVRTTF
jgi:L-asparaginase II